eukprot:1192144-Prorocentrum_minimum.AAC.2
MCCRPASLRTCAALLVQVPRQDHPRTAGSVSTPRLTRWMCGGAAADGLCERGAGAVPRQENPLSGVLRLVQAHYGEGHGP